MSAHTPKAAREQDAPQRHPALTLFAALCRIRSPGGAAAAPPIRLFLALAAAFVVTFASGCDASSSGSSDSSPGEGQRLDQQDVDRLMTDPDSFKGATITVTGQVFDVGRDEGQTAIQIDPGGDGNLIAYLPEEDFDVADQDYVTLTGEVTGTFTGENALGGEVTAPTIEATTARKTTAAALDPAEDVIPGKSIQTGTGVVIRVSKIELASKETRVFLSIRNDSAEDFSLSGDPVLIAGGAQLEPEIGSDSADDYITDLAAGARTRGVVVFPRLEPSGPISLTFKGYDSEYTEQKWRLEW